MFSNENYKILVFFDTAIPNDMKSLPLLGVKKEILQDKIKNKLKYCFGGIMSPAIDGFA